MAKAQKITLNTIPRVTFKNIPEVIKNNCMNFAYLLSFCNDLRLCNLTRKGYENVTAIKYRYNKENYDLT